MKLLNLELAADPTGERFGARIETVPCGVSVSFFPTRGIVLSPTYARMVAEAILAAADLVEGRKAA
jgi:hypothetical protein